MSPEHRRAFQIVIWTLFTFIATLSIIVYLFGVMGFLLILPGLMSS